METPEGLRNFIIGGLVTVLCLSGLVAGSAQPVPARGEGNPDATGPVWDRGSGEPTEDGRLPIFGPFWPQAEIAEEETGTSSEGYWNGASSTAEEPNRESGPARQHRPRFLSSFKLPETLEFAGQAVPLDNWQVRERIEYEFYQFLAAEGDSIIIAKRTGRCFPPVERELAKAGLPDDLKYMLLVESKCVARAYSRAKASGPWQFVRSTGRRYKLKTNKWRDERRNLELSTAAAIKYLSHLKGKMGDWYLAMAAYNAGQRRITKRLREQKVDNYWKMHYVRETMRYVPRIIAAKEIFSQPEKYLGLTKEDLYAPLETQTVTIRIKKRKEHLAIIAEKHGTYYLELRMLNPELKRAHLPRGTYKLKVPKQDCPFGCYKQDDHR